MPVALETFGDFSALYIPLKVAASWLNRPWKRQVSLALAFRDRAISR